MEKLGRSSRRHPFDNLQEDCSGRDYIVGSVCVQVMELLSFQPSLWRCIHLKMYKRFDNKNMVSLAMMAVDRSEGFVEELYMESFPTDELMLYIADRMHDLCTNEAQLLGCEAFA
ncbi:hypothetical protein KSP40_PGU005605 [Platanthera guangdongensis]|uniref:Uncharacterized protein n=1 Tax=Platanthera guangdongensis TaxID=2320717 RepID=A0ABR2MPP3_9ASPA